MVTIKRKKKQAHNRTRLHDLKLAETLEHRDVHAVGPNIGVFRKILNDYAYHSLTNNKRDRFLAKN